MENQDFLNYLKEKQNREGTGKIEGQQEMDIDGNKFADVLLIVLLYKNEDMKVRAPYDIEILGKKMWQWVANSASGAKVKTTPCTKESNIIELIRPFVGTEKYTMVLYADTPLLSRSSLLEILDYFKSRGLNVLKLKRGMVFDSEYLKNCETILAPTNSDFDGQEFMQVDSLAKVAVVQDILKQQIINYHMQNGVLFVDINSTYVDADVVIEKGAIIGANNHLLGQTYIGENCLLEPNNIIKDSVISKNCVIKCSYISGSGISENSIIGPFDKIIDQNL